MQAGLALRLHAPLLRHISVLPPDSAAAVLFGGNDRVYLIDSLLQLSIPVHDNCTAQTSASMKAILTSSRPVQQEVPSDNEIHTDESWAQKHLCI